MLGNPQRPSVMDHGFSKVPHVDIPRSTFRRNHTHKTAFDSGYLVPIWCDEALPGDTFSVNLTSLARLSTPIVPFMDNLRMDFFFFACPNRLLWTNWKRMMGEQDDPTDSISYTVPRVSFSGAVSTGSLWDYFGLPIAYDLSNDQVNALHSRMYNKVWNEWFRHQDLQDSVTVDSGDGPDTAANYVLLRRNKRHDYFTSALPNPQKGSTAVDVPLGTKATVKGIGKHDTTWLTGPQSVYESDHTQPSYDYYQDIGSVANKTFYVDAHSNGSFYAPDIYADLSNATAATINEWREAFQLQRMLERDARGGTRYPEIILSHFQVTNPDARMQRSEYLGGGSIPINITPIPQTSESNTTKQGTLAAIGVASQSGVGFTKSFTEHCCLICLANVRADLTYQQGLHRMWSRQTKHDFYWPALAHLGEQAIVNKELWGDAGANDEETFGYIPRWDEYRYGHSMITGILRSDAAANVDEWHLSQDFASRPALNSDFIEENPPVSRVVADNTEPEFIFDGYFEINCARPMPVYSVPGLIDHF